MLPVDLLSAEAQAQAAIAAALAADAQGRWTCEWRFEGLRLLPPVLRLLQALDRPGQRVSLVFTDAGGAALARRDAPDLADRIIDFRQLQQRQPSEGVLLVVSPAAADYETFEALCQNHQGPVVMVNGRLEDAAVGIGSVARERRRGFVAQWKSAYALIPLEAGALRFAFPGEWEVYRQDPDGYRLAGTSTDKPDAEALAGLLDDSSGVGSTLRAVDSLIEGLRN